MKIRYLYDTAIVAAMMGLLSPVQAIAQQSGAQRTSSQIDAAGAPAAQEEGTEGASDDILVTGSAFRNQEAVQNRRQALGVVDTLTQDDTGDPHISWHHGREG